MRWLTAEPSLRSVIYAKDWRPMPMPFALGGAVIAWGGKWAGRQPGRQTQQQTNKDRRFCSALLDRHATLHCTAERAAKREGRKEGKEGRAHDGCHAKLTPRIDRSPSRHVTMIGHSFLPSPFAGTQFIPGAGAQGGTERGGNSANTQGREEGYWRAF